MMLSSLYVNPQGKAQCSVMFTLHRLMLMVTWNLIVTERSRLLLKLGEMKVIQNIPCQQNDTCAAFSVALDHGIPLIFWLKCLIAMQ